ncbi:DUF3043 domain-containing protein [uncultured Jatrophihabitans sp.]|uniref:DUF3043 domain-containing protein n=1 Tax=uncultured Jatrophihabitans sp. TaxID=1610747 RepID=UPI0035CBD2C4
MKLSRRDKSASAETESAGVAVDDVPGGKGRPTPKRRESQGKRGPVSAPRTRKEAYARQKQLGRQQKTAARATTAKPRSVAEQRAALKRGDPSALPRRDQGPTRKLARDYVDSRRLFSNYLLWLFPLMVASAFVRGLQIVQFAVLLAFLGLLVEWYIIGRRIRALAIERFGSTQGGNMTIGFYAGGRAYLPRKWRMPAPQVARGDTI